MTAQNMMFYKNIGKNTALILLAAALEILSFPPFNYYWLSFVFAVPLFIFLHRERRLVYLLIGFFVYRILVALGIVYFVFDPIMFFALALIFLGLPLSFYFIGKLRKELAFPSLLALWPFWEQLEAYYTALPNFIMVIGNALGQSPFLGLASFGGLTTLTVFAISINLLIFSAFYYWRDKKQLSIFIIGLFFVLLSGWQASRFFLEENKNNYFSRQNIKKIALISDNGYLDEIFKNQNLDPIQLTQAIDDALTPVLFELMSKEIDIVVLPEAMIDVDFDQSVNERAFSRFKIANNGILVAKYGELAAKLNKSLVAGITSIQEGKRYNTLLFFDGNGELIDIFNKKFLTITGEYWPFGDWRPFYFNWILKLGSKEVERYKNYAIFDQSKSFSPGETKSVRLGNLIIAPVICLEIHYPAEIKRRLGAEGNLILNTSSNMWISAGSKQYLDLTNNLRRIESVWLRSPITVNGRREPSGLITPDGKIISSDFETKDKNYNIFIVDVRI